VTVSPGISGGAEASAQPGRTQPSDRSAWHATPSGPAWLHEDPEATQVTDFPVLPDEEPDGGQLARRAAGAEMAELAVYVKQLSGDSIQKVTPGGPVLARLPKRRLRSSTFSPAVGTRVRILITVLSTGWIACLANFWVWWLEPSHRTSAAGTVINSLIIAYVTCFPIFFVVAANHLRRVSRSVAVPLLRTAFVVTRAPSEPWEVAEATLTAMLHQDFPIPYDVWLCDERPSAEVVDWCRDNGVVVATRNGMEKYHRTAWPRRTKCKEGNLAYFYDHWGYQNYDVVAQLDCDHKPSSTYLAEMVRPFSDPAVGYVAAPSVCDTNAATSWVARGRLHKEGTFHGAFQLGHSGGRAPLCIGSHYAVRTRALRDIGGVGPELAEDFSTTFLFNAAGWQGAFAIDAEAHGDGPHTFGAMLVQEFQWSRSLTVVLLSTVWHNFRRLSLTLKLRFIYALVYYTLLVMSTFGGLILAPYAAVTGRPWISVNYFVFLLHWWSISIWLILMTLLLRRQGLLRPKNAPIISWENWLYTLARWPYIAQGIFSALVQRVYPRPFNFKVTPKVAGGLEPLPVRLMVPYLVISCGSATAALIGEATNNAAGYVFLCILSGFVYSLIAILVPVLHSAELAAHNNMTIRAAIRRTSMAPLILGYLSLIPVAVALTRYPHYVMTVFHIHL
jgi:cellulose synthase (UDP-forming)